MASHDARAAQIAADEEFARELQASEMGVGAPPMDFFGQGPTHPGARHPQLPSWYGDLYQQQPGHYNRDAPRNEGYYNPDAQRRRFPRMRGREPTGIPEVLDPVERDMYGRGNFYGGRPEGRRGADYPQQMPNNGPEGSQRQRQAEAALRRQAHAGEGRETPMQRHQRRQESSFDEGRGRSGDAGGSGRREGGGRDANGGYGGNGGGNANGDDGGNGGGNGGGSYWGGNGGGSNWNGTDGRHGGSRSTTWTTGGENGGASFTFSSHTHTGGPDDGPFNPDAFAAFGDLLGSAFGPQPGQPAGGWNGPPMPGGPGTQPGGGMGGERGPPGLDSLFGDPSGIFETLAGMGGPGANAGRAGRGGGSPMGNLFAQLFQAVGRGGGDENRSYEDWLSFIDSQMGGRSNRGATEDEINDLPTETVPIDRKEKTRGTGGASSSGAGSSSSPATATDEEKCPICLGEFEAGTVLKRLPCTHVFCDSCISQWLHINKECPCCKASIRDGTRS